jgi:predicted dehydrogenase
MHKKAPVKLGFLGGGMISQVAHLPFYLRDPRCEVVSICESRPSLVEALSQQVGAARIVKQEAALFENSEIEAIVLSVPRPATGPLTLAALAAGKHVLAEKPMAHSVEQARRLVDAAASRKLIYAIGFMKRYDPGVQAAKALFDEVAEQGTLGQLLHARFYDFSNSYAHPVPPHVRPKESRAERFPIWPMHPDWLPEGLRSSFAWFLNVASHDVNLLRMFFPRDLEVLSVHCVPDKSVMAMLRQGQAMISLEIVKAVTGSWIEGIDFIFERGQIKVVIPSPMATESVSTVILDDEPRKMIGKRIEVGQGWSFARQAIGFVDALTGTAAVQTSGEDAFGDMLLTEQIWRQVAA